MLAESVAIPNRRLEGVNLLRFYISKWSYSKTVATWLLATLSSLVAPVNAADQAYSERIEELDPVAYWRLGETAGFTAYDEVGAYDGDYVGPLLGESGALTGDSDTSIQLDGIDDYVDVGAPIVSGDELTITAWIKVAAGSSSSMGVISQNSLWKALFVTDDPSNLTTQESARISLLEDWGYEVILVDSSAAQAEYDAIVAGVDVAYVSGKVSATAIGNKLANSTAGIVSENAELADNFGFAGTETTVSSKSFRVLNTFHYITSNYAVGDNVTVVTGAPTTLCLLDDNFAQDLVQLAETKRNGNNYRPSLAVIEAGGDLYGGGMAVSRRAMLPWCAGNFDPSKLNSDGLEIMQRSVDWAAGRVSTSSELARYTWALEGELLDGELDLTFTLRAGGTTEQLTYEAGSAPVDKWTFVVAVYDNTSMTLYVDGSEVASLPRSGVLSSPSDLDTWIGNRPAVRPYLPLGNPFAGLIDEVAIFDMAITPDEIAELAAYRPRGVRIIRWVEVR